MSQAAELDVLGCPLQGAALIEASAGTGKTWNICALYLRLLLERELGVRQILVVTFTNAATAELRERIRARIGDTLGFLRAAGPAAADPFVPALVAAIEQRGIAQERMEQLLDQALQAFDEAAIFTIHGFCQRALAETPFAAGLPFASTLEPDDDALLQEAVNDFWRREIGGGTLAPELAAYLLERKDTPQTLARLLRRQLAKPTARCLWPEPAADDDIGAAAERIGQLFEAARALWQAEADAIRALLNAALPDFTSKVTADKIAAACDACDQFFAAERPAQLPNGLRGVAMKLLRQSELAAQLKKNRPPPAHPFFGQIETLLAELPALQQRQDEVLQHARLRLLRALLEQAAPALRQRKRELRTLAYDDLLYNVHEALAGGRFPWLAATLRERYPAALIDEFQDTDPLQFGVFDAIYGDSDAPLFLVGDPKQAIYSFRNADLHTYLQAKRRAGAIHTLAANQRSSAGLIAGLNALFSANPVAFMLDGLDYQQVRCGAKPRTEFVDRSGEARADLQLWMLPAADDELLLRGAARRAAIDACAAEIARLLAAAQRGEVMLDGRPRQPGDIAVLVRNHA
ncbi:MAG: UvrD-helicase domain-containing protein, partial [Burkholderiaceae bacterium]